MGALSSRASKPHAFDSGYASTESGSVPASPVQSVTTHRAEDDPNAAFAAELRRKTLKITGPMLTMFRDISWPVVEIRADKWTERQSERYARLRRDTNAILDLALAGNPKRLQKAKDCDYALFNFVWYPDIDDYDALWTESLLTTWLFVWDDCIDSNDGTLSTDFSQAAAFREETIAKAKELFGAAEGNTDSLAPVGPMVVLAEFAKRIRERFNPEQLEGMFQEISRFVEGVGREQAHRLAGYLPKTLDEYFSTRAFSSGVYPCFLALELASSHALPAWVMNSDEMKTIFRAGNRMISLHNDIMSLKKEVANICVINSLPVLYFAGVPWDQVLPRLDGELRNHAREIDENAESLLQKVADDQQLRDTTAQLIEGIKINTTGNVSYSLVTKRYNCLLENNMREDGSLEIII